jgi:hypothetical protein
MFHRLFQAISPSNNEKARKTSGHAVKHCFTGFFNVSGEENLFPAEPGWIRREKSLSGGNTEDQPARG